MRNVFKIVSSLGSVALLLSGAAMAAPPVPFNTWSVSSTGVISGEGAGCSAPVVGTGFLQCQVVIGGKTYIQTIIAEGFGATGTTLDRLSFRSQDFVQIGAGSSQGLASTMAIKDTITNPGTTFGTSADILTGWATSNAGTATANKSEAVLALNVSSVASAAGAFDDFNSTFGVTAITDSGNVNRITALNVGQTVGLGSSTDRQRFELKNVGATQAIWAGQSVTGSGDFSVTTSTNMGTGAIIGTSTSLASTAVDTAVWTATFGAAPTF